MLNRLRTFFQDLLVSMGQYPGAYIVAVAIAILGLIMNHADYPDGYKLSPYLFSLILTLPLILAGPFMQVVKPSLSHWYRYGGQVVALVIGLLFYCSLPESLNDPSGSEALRLVFSLVTAWLFPLLAIVVATRGDAMMIRGWSRQFIFSLGVSIVSAMIMWGGISASIASIEYLFDISLSNNGDIYLDIGIIAWSILGTAVRLTRLHDTPEEREYNKLFRFFGLYIFTPLTLVYTLILIAYAIKIVLLQERPAGGTVWLVGRFMAFSMLGYLLIYPLIEQTPRLRKAQQGYMVSVILFTLYLVVALIKRLEYHGFTVEEYYIILLALWMLVIGVVSLWRRQWSLSVIVSLLIVLLGVSIYGPWSATNISTQLQYQRLHKLLGDNNFLRDDYIIVSHDTLNTGASFSLEYQQIYTTASYLGRQEGTGIFKSFYSGTGFDQLAKMNRRNLGDQFMDSLGLLRDSYIQDQLDDGYRYFNIYSDTYTPHILDIAGYSQFAMISSNMLDNNLLISTGSLTITTERKDRSLLIIKQVDKTTTIDLYEHVDSISGDLRTIKDFSSEPLIFVKDNYMIILTEVSGQRLLNDSGYEISYYRAIVLLK